MGKVSNPWVFVTLCLFKLVLGRNEYIDLSYSFNNDTIYYPGQRYNFELHKDLRQTTPYWYASYSFCMAEHGGTHVDAPYHFNSDGWTLDQIPMSHFVDIPAAVVDVERHVFAAESPAEFSLQVEHLIEHESINGKIPTGGVVLVHTGWSKYWPDKQKYLGWAHPEENNVSVAKPELHFPGCSEQAAKWLTNERNIVGFGLDTASVDIGFNQGHLPVHIHFGASQVYNIENVANLHLVLKQVNASKADGWNCVLRLFVLPLKVTGGTGGPARILAFCK